MKRLAGALAVALLLGLVPGEAPAADDAPDVAAIPSATIQPLARIGAAVGAVGALGWGLALWARRRRSNGGDDARIELLARRSLGPRHHVALIEVTGRRLLVGIGTESVRLVADVTDGIAFEAELERRIDLGGAPSAAETERATSRAQPRDERGLVELIGRFEGLDG